MSNTIEFRVMELLCSRLCHDLISPVSAINNGMELLADDDGGMADDIRELLASSAHNASQRLQFFRVAYGLGGDDKSPIPLETAMSLTNDYASDSKATLSWDAPAAFPELSRVATKAVINLVVLGLEALPRGGDLTVSAVDGGVTVTCAGQGAQLTDETQAALSDGANIEALTPRSVQAYFTRALFRRAGGSLTADSGDQTVTFDARFA